MLYLEYNYKHMIVDTLTIVTNFFSFKEFAMVLHVTQYQTNVNHLDFEPLEEIGREKNILCGIEAVKEDKYIK